MGDAFLEDEGNRIDHLLLDGLLVVRAAWWIIPPSTTAVEGLDL
jgi:hypothetical protein